MVGALTEERPRSGSSRLSLIAFKPRRSGVRIAACTGTEPLLAGAINEGDLAVTPRWTTRPLRLGKNGRTFVRFFSLTQAETFAYTTLRTLKALDRTRITPRLARLARPAKASEQYPIHVPIAELVYADLRRRSAEHQATVSRLASDLLAIIAGHPELADEFDPVTLCLPARLADAINWPVTHPAIGTRIRTEVFIPGPVYAVVCDCATQNACLPEQIAADLLAIATGHSGAIRHLGQAEMRRLASESLAAAVNGAGAGTYQGCTE